LKKLALARDLALEEAKKSPCVRRKYGAIFFKDNINVLAHNKRVSRCCDGICIRDVMSITHGHNTDVGAEIHAEQALLINSNYVAGYWFLIAGYGKNGQPLYGLENWPCYSCARMIKEAGITRVWVPEVNDTFTSYLIDGILEDYEQQILGAVGDF
jgi:deoxycytidylate deaminase